MEINNYDKNDDQSDKVMRKARREKQGRDSCRPKNILKKDDEDDDDAEIDYESDEKPEQQKKSSEQVWMLPGNRRM